MVAEIPKHYDAAEAEVRWQKRWAEQRIYRYDPNSPRPTYSIDTPPPYASADHLHVGHAMHYSQFEFIARYKRMSGFNVFFPMGFDDNGLPTERYVERKHKVNKKSISRSAFIKLCIEETKKTGKVYHDLFTRLGFSVDWELLYQTIDERSRRVSQASFLDLHAKERLVREDLPTTWCVSCQTTIAQADMESRELASHFNDVAFHAGGDELIIATTRPELIPACVALFAHPDDERYAHLAGRFATVPLFNYEVPILFDESVEREVGTGLMMCCTFGDKEDIEKWHKHRLPLRIAFTEDGKLNQHAPGYEGMQIKQARGAIIDALREAGHLKGQRAITHAVNVHERCGTEVEFLKKPQWSIKVLDAKQELIEAADRIAWYPQHMKVRYQHWVANLQWDWCISRQRYYGVPFPVWYCKRCGAVKLATREELPVDPREQQPSTPCTCGSHEFVPEMDVMDTWMTSSCTPRINQRWTLRDERDKFMPMSLRPQAHDIIRTWAFYTIVKEHYHAGAKPWDAIMISGHGQDPHGQKMSKSKNNFIVAQEVIAKYSADALRWWAAGVKLGDDLPFMEKDLVSGSRMITKLWNASRFVISHLDDYDGTRPEELEAMDCWILNRLNEVIRLSSEHFERYEYSRTRLEVEKFFWQSFCDNYLEICKERIYNPEAHGALKRRSAQYALACVLSAVLRLLAPIMPHISEEIYQLRFAVEGASIHTTCWPEPIEVPDRLALGDSVVEAIAAVRKHKAERKLSLKAPIRALKVAAPIDLASAELDLKGATRAEKVDFSRAEAFSCEIVD